MSMEGQTNGLSQIPKAIGFIGLGNMGWWMALNLRKQLDSSSTLYIFDIISSILDKFVNHTQGSGLGPVVICKSAREVAEHTEVTFVIVPEGKHARDVFFNPTGGLLAGPVEGKTFVDSSTIDTVTSTDISKAVKEASSAACFYDAPVSGGTQGAEKGTLTFMAGASEEDEHFKARIDPLVRRMGKTVFYLGGPTLGLAAKLANNYMSATLAIVTSEAMNMGMRHGIDPKLLYEIFKKSTGNNYTNEFHNPVPGICPNAPPSKGYQGGFRIQMMVKDMKLALASAEEVGAKLVLGEPGLAAYMAAAEDPRCKDLDSRVIYRWIADTE